MDLALVDSTCPAAFSIYPNRSWFQGIETYKELQREAPETRKHMRILLGFSSSRVPWICDVGLRASEKHRDWTESC